MVRMVRTAMVKGEANQLPTKESLTMSSLADMVARDVPCLLGLGFGDVLDRYQP
jgi:hypothetical protein